MSTGWKLSNSKNIEGTADFVLESVSGKDIEVNVKITKNEFAGDSSTSEDLIKAEIKEKVKVSCGQFIQELNTK